MNPSVPKIEAAIGKICNPVGIAARKFYNKGN
jgi:hypothetical protein